MTCEATLGGLGGLRCVREIGHANGHEFHSSAASELGEGGHRRVEGSE